MYNCEPLFLLLISIILLILHELQLLKSVCIYACYFLFQILDRHLVVNRELRSTELERITDIQMLRGHFKVIHDATPTSKESTLQLNINLKIFNFVLCKIESDFIHYI